MTSPICILGAGAFGTALAILLARNGNQVRLWTNEPAHLQALIKTHENKRYLPGIKLPDPIKPCVHLTDALDGVDDVLVVVPSRAFAEVIAKLPKDLRIAWATKGMSGDHWLHELVQQRFGGIPMAALSGPSFAREVALDLPTAVTLACNDEQFCQDLLQRFCNHMFRIYTTDDLLGVAIGSVVKNIMAVASGMAVGLQLGENAVAALITRGLTEILCLANALGAKQETLMGLSGLGDLVLTCTSKQSRNRQFGELLALNFSVNEIQEKIGGVVEAQHNLQTIYQLAKKNKIEMPITEQVYFVLYDALDPKVALENLLARS